MHEYSTGSRERGVSHDKEWFSVVQEGKDGLLEECFLNFGEGDFVVYGPLPLGVFMGKGKERFRQV